MDTSAKRTNIVRVAIFAAILIGLIILMRFVAKGSQSSGKYDSFAQCLVSNGVKFYGAFWCPHCQEQEKWLDASRQTLASEGLYNECSAPNGQSQLQSCTDQNIEGYPTWVYQKGFTVTSQTAPTVCDIQPGPAGQPAQCASFGSHIFKTWIFSNVKAQSAEEPSHTGDTWTFAPGSRTSGELPVAELSSLTSCALPATQK